MTRALLLGLVGISLAACTDFDDVTRDVCGNGLLEPGEDCDSSDVGCVRCAVSCSSAADCPNAEYACGVDGFCHAPGGQLASPTAPVTLQADELRVTDIDHDGTGDVLGVSRTSIVVRYGDAAGALSASDSFVTPVQSGPPAFGDLDGDGSTDVALTTPDGIVSYTSEFRTLSPLDIESPIYDENGQALDMISLFAVGARKLGAFIADNDIAFLVILDFEDMARSKFVAPCAARLGAISPSRIDTANIDLYLARSGAFAPTDFIVSFTTTTGQLCVTSIHDFGTRFTATDVTPAGAGLVQRKAILADVDTDGDPCPSLVNSDGGAAALRAWKGRLAAIPQPVGEPPIPPGNHCVFDAAGAGGAALPAVQDAPGSATVVGRVPIEPAIPLFAADALVLTSGMYAYIPSFTMIAPLHASSRKIARVAHGDLDNDGDVDAVLVPADEEDLDLMYRYPSGVELLRLDTASRVTTVTIGDYDGNSFADLAYSETGSNHQKFMIAYGTPDRHLPATQVASFSGVGSVTRIEFPDTADNLSIADDLFVIQPGAANALPTMTLLHGSPQRTMLSFFDPRSDAMRDDTGVRGAVIGDFVAGADRDMLVVATPNPGKPVGLRAWKVAGTAAGLDSQPSDGVSASGLADCAVESTGVCVQDTLYLPWPQADGRDVVIAIDRTGGTKAALLDPWTPSSVAATPVPVLVGGVPAGALARSMYAADLDGDAESELVVSFATLPGAAQPTGTVRVCSVANGLPQQCEDLAPAVLAIAPEITACIDAAPARIAARDPSSTPSTATDLVVLCRGASTATSLFRVSRTAGILEAALLAQGNALRSIRVGDVTGDGVDDVVAIQGEGGASSLVVYPQCTSRALGGCRAGAAASAEGDQP